MMDESDEEGRLLLLNQKPTEKSDDSIIRSEDDTNNDESDANDGVDELEEGVNVFREDSLRNPRRFDYVSGMNRFQDVANDLNWTFRNPKATVNMNRQ